MWNDVTKGQLPVKDGLYVVFYKRKDIYYGDIWEQEVCLFTTIGIPSMDIPPNSFMILTYENKPIPLKNVEYWTYPPEELDYSFATDRWVRKGSTSRVPKCVHWDGCQSHSCNWDCYDEP
jgi:hypothetical protein